MVRNSRRRGAGFTLTEILVTIAIISLLAAMLLPAIQAARESGRKTRCQANLKQIGTASQSYVSQFEHLPSGGWGYGWVGDPNHAPGAGQPGGWIYNILPYMEGVAIHDLGKQYAGFDATNMAKRKTELAEQTASIVPYFYCPSRRRPKLYPNYPGSPNQLINANQVNAVGKTDYAINGGTSVGFANFAGPVIGCDQSFPRTPCSFSPCDAAWLRQIFNGVSGVCSEIRTDDISDGATNTLLAAEKYLNSDVYTLGTDGGDAGPFTQGYGAGVVRWCDIQADLRPRQDTETPAVSPGKSFGSIHSGVFFAVFCDGSTRGLDYSIDPVVFARMGNRKDSRP